MSKQRAYCLQLEFEKRFGQNYSAENFRYMRFDEGERLFDVAAGDVQLIKVALNDAVKADYKRFEQSLVLELGDKNLVSSTAAVLANKLI